MCKSDNSLHHFNFFIWKRITNTWGRDVDAAHNWFVQELHTLRDTLLRTLTLLLFCNSKPPVHCNLNQWATEINTQTQWRLKADFPKASQIFQDIRSCKRLIFPGPKDFSQDRIVTITNHYWLSTVTNKLMLDIWSIWIRELDVQRELYVHFALANM